MYHSFNDKLREFKFSSGDTERKLAALFSGDGVTNDDYDEFENVFGPFKYIKRYNICYDINMDIFEIDGQLFAMDVGSFDDGNPYSIYPVIEVRENRTVYKPY